MNFVILELIEKRAEVVKELKQLEEKSEPVTKLFQDDEFLEKAQTSRFGTLCPFVLYFFVYIIEYCHCDYRECVLTSRFSISHLLELEGQKLAALGLKLCINFHLKFHVQKSLLDYREYVL